MSRAASFQLLQHLVEEGKTSDEVRKSIVQFSATVGHVAIVANEFGNGKHGQTSVLKFRGLTLGSNFRVESGHTGFEGSQVTIVVNGTNEEKHLEPAKGGDGFDGLDTVGDSISVGATGDEVVVSTGELGEDVSENSQH